MNNPVNIICMKWGTRYGPEFVNRLYKSIKKHTKRITRLYCLTDDDQNIDKNIILTGRLSFQKIQN